MAHIYPIDYADELPQYLSRTEQYIALGRERIAHQLAIIAKRERMGLDASRSRGLLATFRQSVMHLEAAAERMRRRVDAEDLEARLMERSKAAVIRSHNVLRASLKEPNHPVS